MGKDICLDIYIHQYMLLFQYMYIQNTELTENGNFRLFSAKGKEVCFPWLADNKH
jgi:hypothetical protein